MLAERILPIQIAMATTIIRIHTIIMILTGITMVQLILIQIPVIRIITMAMAGILILMITDIIITMIAALMRCGKSYRSIEMYPLMMFPLSPLIV